jgi:hypothetical protein
MSGERKSAAERKSELIAEAHEQLVGQGRVS